MQKWRSYLLLYLFIFQSFVCETKIYDCFCFYNEFEILKMRLEELWDHVDYFVLVESIETQRGDTKPLYFENHKESFSKYLEKIIHVKIEEHHPEFSFWERENYQRNCIMRGLKKCKACDIIIISDVDEIPRPSLFPQAICKLSQIKTASIKGGYPVIAGVTMEQMLYFHQLNRRPADLASWGGGLWHGTVFTDYENLILVDPQYFRNYRSHFPYISNGGWHFTWMGGRDYIRLKAKSVVEGNPDTATLSDAEVDTIIERETAVLIDDSFPEYVRKNFNYLYNLGYIAKYPSHQ